MSKKCKIFMIVLFLVIVSGVITAGAIGFTNKGEVVSSKVSAKSSSIPEDQFPDKTINHSYNNNKETSSNSFYYNDGMLFHDSRSLSTNLAKASVALAGTAYNKDRINSLLDSMGYKKYDNSTSYSKARTLNDNDMVAYTIAYKEVEYNGEKYIIYCIPIKGTSGNCEWYSNFNVGTSGNHTGFYTATNEVLEELLSYLKSDKDKNGNSYDASHTIVWTTGHSRGAGVANILAGKLSTSYSGYVSTNHVFGYTFACPSVSKFADTTLTNIYNYNNSGDLITIMPLEEWGYKRFGKTINLDMDEDYDNFKIQFKRINNKEYEGLKNSDGYKAVLKSLFKNEADTVDASGKLFFLLTGYALGGSSNTTIPELIVKAGYTSITATLSEIINSTPNIYTLYNSIKNMNSEVIELITFVNENAASVSNMTDQEFLEFVARNEKTFKKISKYCGIQTFSIDVYFTLSSILVNNIAGTTESIYSVVSSVASLYYDSNGNPVKAIEHGHLQSTYVLWVNSMYVGYRGWYGNDAVKSLSIPDNITNIGQYAFYDCTGLTSITIPDSVTSIGYSAFKGCTGLTSVKIGNGVTSIDYEAFNNCSSLEYISIPFVGSSRDANSSSNYFGYIFGALSYSNNKSYVPTSLKEVVITDTENIGSYAFYNCTGLTSVTISDSVTGIGEGAFYGCTGLTSVTIGNSVTSIGYSAFRNCTGLTSVTIPDSAELIGHNAFYNCTGLTSVTIPDSVTRVESSAFSGCTGLTSVNISSIEAWCKIHFSDLDANPLYYANNLYLNGTLVTDLLIPDSVTSIEYGAFYRCTGLTSITIPDSVTSIGYSAFKGCTGIKSITIGAGVTSIGDEAFYNCSSLEYISIPFVGSSRDANSNSNYFGYIFGADSYSDNNRYVPTSLKKVVITDAATISHRAFYNCTGLTSVTIPDSAELIGDYAFYNCTGLTSITIGNGVTSIGREAFYGCISLEQLFFGSKLSSIGTDAFHQCISLKSISVDTENKTFSSDSYGALFNKPKTELIKYPMGNSRIKYIIPESVTRLSAYSFGYSYNLEDIIIPDNVAVIGSESFRNCKNLKSIIIPDIVSAISSYSFSGCDKLSQVYIPSSVTAISDYAFEKCISLEKIKVPKNVTSIGYYAFSGCVKLKDVNFYTTNLSVGSGAFLNCVGLNKIVFPCSISAIGSSALSGCINLNSITVMSVNANFGKIFGASDYTYNSEKVPESLKEIVITGGSSVYEKAFYQCTNITKVVIPNTVKTIGSYAFSGCSKLQNVPLPTGLKTIEKYAFRACKGLLNVEIPDGTSILGECAYKSCSNLKSIIIPDSVINIEDEVFELCPILTISCNSNSKAREYAEANGIKYILLDKQTITPVEGSTAIIDTEKGFIYGLCEGIYSLEGFVECEGATLQLNPTVAGYGTGSTVDIIVDGKVVDTMTIVIFGDMTGDGYADGFDVSSMASVINWENDLSEDSPYYMAADITNDGVIDESDFVLLDLASIYAYEIPQTL